MRAAVYGGGAAAVVAFAVIGALYLHSPSPSPPPPSLIAVNPPGGMQTASVPPAVNPQQVKVPPAPAPNPGNPAEAAALAGPLAATVAAANRGDPTAQNQLGVKYAQGEDGLPRDDVKAVEWYRKAANQGLPKAQTNLGDMYFFGRGGLSQSYLDALSWYLKAAQQDWPDAQYRLGFMYEKGIGTGKDVAKAVQLYRGAS